MSENSMSKMYDDFASILVSKEEIADIVARMTSEITRDYEGKELLLIAVLRGAVVFVADLMRAIACPLNVDFMAVSSYGYQAKSSGAVRILKDLDTEIEGKHILIIEDILDSGLTLKYLMENLSARKPASLEVAAFLVKDVPDVLPAIKPKYVGTHVPNEFIVGYGLDCSQRYRQFPFIAVLKPEAYM